MSFLGFFSLRNKEPRIARGFRGEQIHYKKGGKEIEIDFTWCNGDRLYTETIDHWTGGNRLSDDEKEIVFFDVLNFLSRPLRRTIVVINTDDPSRSLWEELSKLKAKLVREIEYDSFEKQREFRRQMYLDTMQHQNVLVVNNTEITSVEELDRFLAKERNVK
ncbi:MAG: hypothetical protein PSX80_09215 [bacterium]|nr:hypothetical protein [bacterium]